MNRRPEVLEQASAAINVCRCRFPAGGRNIVVYIFAPCSRISGRTDRNRDLWAAEGTSFAARLSLEREQRCVSPLHRATTWRNRSSIFWSTRAVLVAWAIDAVVGSGATFAIRLASREATSRLPSAWPTSMVSMWGGSLLDPYTSQEVVGYIRCWALQVARELGRFAVPHLFVRQELADALSWDDYRRRTNSVFRVVHGPSVGGDIIIIVFIYWNWVVTRWQWLCYMYTKHEIGYY